MHHDTPVHFINVLVPQGLEPIYPQAIINQNEPLFDMSCIKISKAPEGDPLSCCVRSLCVKYQ